MARISTTKIGRGDRKVALVGWLCAITTLLLWAAPANASSTIFTNTGSICTVTAPCSEAQLFGLLIGVSTGTGGYNTGALVESGGSSNTTTTIGEPIGIGAKSSIDTTGGGSQTWTGPIDFSDTGNGRKTSNGYSVPSNSDRLTNVTITGGTQLGQSSVDTALNQIFSMGSYWSGASGQTSLGTLGGTPTTIGTIGGGVQVFSATSINVSNVITIQGNSTDLIIINDPSTAIFQTGGSIVLSGGITPDQVLFNLTGTGNVLNISGGGTISADFILRGSFDVASATLDGRILGGRNTNTLGPDFFEMDPAPEPGGWALMAGGLGALFYLGRGLPGGTRAPLSGRWRWLRPSG